MNHLNALDFNVCRSEEVISFFWRSVYFYERVLLAQKRAHNNKVFMF